MSRLTDILTKLNQVLDSFVSGQNQPQGAAQTLFGSQNLYQKAQQGLGGLNVATGGATGATVESAKTGGQTAWQGAKQMFTTQRAGEAFSGASGVVQGAGQAMGGPLGGLVEKFGKLGKYLGESLEKLRAWNEKLHDANMQFAEFSGAMAAVQARQEARDIQLSQQRGDRRADSAERLAQSKTAINQDLAPIEDLLGKAQNDVTGWLNEKLHSIIGDKLKDLGVTANKMYDEMMDRKGSDTKYADEWMYDKGLQYSEDFGKPVRLK